MDKIAICAIFKDEAPYLLEWLAFHRMIGVDLFVLYDNGSTDGGADIVRRSSFAKNVTLLDWAERPGQLSAYNHFRINHAARFTWAGFIDIDEFLMPLAGSSIREILMRRAYAPYAQILLQWLVFGPSGHEARPGGLVIENYTRRLPESAEASRHIKAIVRTGQMRGMDYTPHAAECTGPACNTRGEQVLPYAIQPTECHDVMVVYHYFTKSRQDWEFKRRRGRGDSLEPYQERVFADVAGEALVEDTRALRFVPRLRALLRG
ncbi:MAG: glycosyltransferase family 2 protein [Acetobacteraceae bacterium]